MNKIQRIGEHVLQLKHKMTTARELNTIGEFFFDHLGEDPEFLDMGTPVQRDDIKQLIVTIYKQLTGTKTVQLVQPMLIHLPEFNLVHGGCLVNQHLANIIYCEDLNVGLTMLAKFPPGGDGHTDFSRFSIELRGAEPPNQNN